jgi:hypothetical protein
MSGDFFDSYTKDAVCIQQVEIRDSAEHTVKYRTALHSKDNVAQDVNSAEGKKC